MVVCTRELTEPLTQDVMASLAQSPPCMMIEYLRVAHSHIAVIGHHGQENKLNPTQAQGENNWAAQLTYRGSLYVLQENAPASEERCLWHRDINKGEAGEKEIHGSVESAVQSDQKNNEDCSQHGQQVSD